MTGREHAGGDPALDRRGQLQEPDRVGDLRARAADALGKAYTRDTSDKPTAMRYANVLQMNGKADQALEPARPHRARLVAAPHGTVEGEMPLYHTGTQRYRHR